ncbi:alpha,alpha-trehalase nth1 [Podochytrium sp. JEL0797]|nr:alpha,alpha-trehalase nth1 [Podochytrium sp. JEL0797]
MGSPLGLRQRRLSTNPALYSTNKPITVDLIAENSNDPLLSAPAMELILAQEDTDNDKQVTVTDTGPKCVVVPTANSSGFNKVEIRGTYAISNLLQELEFATDHGRKFIILSEDRLFENPVERLVRLIKFHFWDGLTRRIDADGLEVICLDPKNRQNDNQNRIYVPYHDEIGYSYFSKVAITRPHLNLDVVRLPANASSDFVNSLNSKPGVLALGLRKVDSQKGWEDIDNVCGTPFVVPGGRFNEQYGWDSYFEALGLLIDGRVNLAQGMVENFVYEIEHYGKILNANRSYYLTRSQPPFLTDMIRQVYKCFGRESDPAQSPSSKKVWTQPELKSWLACGTRAAIKELFSIWLSHPRLDSIGLSKFYTEGHGIPPETESHHFDAVLKPFADKLGMSVAEFEEKYTKGEIFEPELDTYFVHDRAVRESGHDTTYRFDGKCANLATIDLNCLVYKYETDLEAMVEKDFGGRFSFNVRRGESDVHLIEFKSWLESLETEGVDKMIGGDAIWKSDWAKGILIYDDSSEHVPAANPSLPSWSLGTELFTVTLPASLFTSLSSRTHSLINQHLWSEQDSLFYDFDCTTQRQTKYESATATWALWANVASQQQADKLIPKCLQLFEVAGGIVATTAKSRGLLSKTRPARQWDYPYGWAPHQIMAWRGLENYGRFSDAHRLTYRWMFTIVKSFYDYNGVVPEKFDVVGMTHRVDVEYGNVGSDFEYVVREGFGWMNASVQIGLKGLPLSLRRSLGALMHPNDVFKRGA